MHGLIDSVPFKAVPYLEAAWVCAPNAAGQAITANTITTLTMDTIVQNTAGSAGEVFENVIIGSNQVQNLPLGTYYFEASTKLKNPAADSTCGVLSLYNVSDSKFESRSHSHSGYTGSPCFYLKGQFRINSTKSFDVRLLATFSTGSTVISNDPYNHAGTNSTAGADQRTTLKLWKVA